MEPWRAGGRRPQVSEARELRGTCRLSLHPPQGADMSHCFLVFPSVPLPRPARAAVLFSHDSRASSIYTMMSVFVFSAETW